jgi:hypothetical protein
MMYYYTLRIELGLTAEEKSIIAVKNKRGLADGNDENVCHNQNFNPCRTMSFLPAWIVRATAGGVRPGPTRRITLGH